MALRSENPETNGSSALAPVSTRRGTILHYPTSEEAADYKQGKTPKQKWTLKGRAALTTAGTITALGTIAGVGAAEHHNQLGSMVTPATVAEDMRSIPNYLAKLGYVLREVVWSPFRPSTTSPDIFNPRANKGEISTKNSVPLPTAEATKLAQERSTSPAEGFHMPLPEPGETPIRYEVRSGELMLDDIPVGRELVFPYRAKLSFQENTETGYVGITLEDIETPGRKPGDKTIINISGRSFDLLFPREKFRVVSNPGTSLTRSSQLLIEPGPILKIKSNETDEYHPYGPHQLYIGGGWKREGQTSSATVDIHILQDSSTNKVAHTQ